MKFVADENLHRVIIQRLRQEGHEVIAIAETAPGIADDAVLAIAVQENALLLTEDKDFGELVFRLQLLATGIVLFRLGAASSQIKAQNIALAIQQHGTDLLGKFAVITPRTVRINSLSIS